jgi:V/A-type H+-transporting ATPase subunit I
MSKTTIIFLKSDAERVMDSLNEQGAFHLSLKEVERQSDSDLSGRVQDLINRLREVTTKVNALAWVGPAIQVAGPEATVIEAPDWPSLISIAEKEILSYEKRVKELEASLQAEAKVKPVFDLWNAFATGVQKSMPLGFLPSLKRLNAVILYNQSARPAKLEGVLPEPSLKFQVASEPYMVLVLCMLGDVEKVTRTAEEVGYSVLAPMEGMPQDYAALPDFLKSYEESLGKSAEINAESRRFLKSLMPRLLYLNSTLSDAHSILSIKEKASVEERWEVLEGYVPSKVASSLVGDLTVKLNGRLIPLLKEEHSSPKVPVTYRYPRFLKLFETITNLYGVPSYNEINPTPILALTFPIFFGLMFGDVGHGIMLAALGLILYKYTQSMSKIGVFLAVCGVFGAIVGGVLYGEAFGRHIGYQTFFSPGEDLMSIFKLALYVGVAQISLGLTISIGNSLIQRKKADAFLVNLPKLILYMVFMYIIFHYGIDLNVWFAGPIFFLFVPIIFLLIGKPAYMFAKHGRKEGTSVLGEISFEVFDSMIRFISNTVSYLRIFAMVIAHIELTSVFYSLGAIVGGGQFGFIFAGLLAILGNVFVVLLEGILVLAQDLRLHFYEWFSKFYEDGGVRFEPFKLDLGVPILKK